MENDEEKKAKIIIEENDPFKQIDILKKFILKLKIENTEEFLKEDKKSLSIKIQIIDKIISLITNEKENFSCKFYFVNRIKVRNLIHLIKSFKYSKKYSKYKMQIIKNKKTINIYFIITIFCIFKKALLIKKESKNKKPIFTLYELLNNFLSLLGKLFLDEIIQINYFELIIKLLVIFVVKNSLASLEEEINTSNEIYNMIFFKSSVLLIKNVFNKILLINNSLSEKQNELINNIIIFIKDNIIHSEIENKQINYKNKYFMSKYDCDTIQLLDLSQIVLRTNSDKVIKNYLDLISDIYSFNFRYENLMRPLLKQLEPLFINLNKKEITHINDELLFSNFSIELINSLINKENNFLSEKIFFMKEGFYLNNEKCGIISNIKSLDNDFTIIFSFFLEKTNKKEISLFSLITDKNVSKFILRKIHGKNSYEMFYVDRNNRISEFKINIDLEVNYIFAITFRNDYNSKIIKIDIFILSFTLYFSMNAIFFNDETMHAIYEKEGSFDFIYNLPQIIYSSLISGFLLYFLKLLALSEGLILKFKRDKTTDDLNAREASLKSCIKIKIAFYFILSTFFILFFWYYISMFCAIYVNTQIHLIKDTIISFNMSFISPFFIYLIPGFFRIPALSKRRKKRTWLYNISKILQML